MKSGIMKRISLELDKQLKELSVKNGISFAEASRELAKISREFRFKGGKIIRETISEIKW